MDTPLGTVRRVEFLGLPHPASSPDVQRMLRQPIRSVAQRRELRAARREILRQERERQRQGFARFQGVTDLTLGPQHGLTQTYVWGPEVFVVEMPLEDIERLMQMHPMHRLAFRVHPDIVVMGRG